MQSQPPRAVTRAAVVTHGKPQAIGSALARLANLAREAGVELHRRQPGFLTGTNIPPSIAIITAVLDCLLAAAQGDHERFPVMAVSDHFPAQ